MFKKNILFFLLLALIIPPALHAQALVATAKWGPPSAANEWQKFTITLVADSFNVTASDFEQIMSNVQRIRIRTETHSGDDIGSLDNVKVGARFTSDFNAGLDGWNAHGDGTMQWTETGGISNSGYIAIHDWARGDWHYAVAPASWSGDWSDLIGSTFEFYYKSDYPDAQADLEISSVFEKRIILSASPLITPPNSSSRVRVSLNEIPDTDVEIVLSSQNSCFEVPSRVVISAGQDYTEFDATVPPGADMGCTSAIEASASGFVSARLILTVGEASGGTNTKLCGQVTDATTGEGIPGAVVTIADLSTVTDDDGNYCIDNIPANVISANFTGSPRSGEAPLTVQFNDLSGTGSLTLTASADNYTTYRSVVSISPGEEKSLDISLSPLITDAEMRIVLNWGFNPEDLDIHLSVPKTEDEGPYHVYYSDLGQMDSYPYAFLDHDDLENYGPETITIKQFVPGTYYFYVHRYSYDGTLVESEAVVQIYDRTGLINTINVPTTGTGEYWYVGQINGSTGQVLINSAIQEDEPVSWGYGLGKIAAKKEWMSTHDIISWQWDFDNNGIIDSDDKDPEWTFNEPGEYTVSLTVSDGTQDYTETKNNYITVTGESYANDAYHVSITSVDITNFPLVKIFISVIDTTTGVPLGTLPNSAFIITENGMDVSDMTISKLSSASGAKADIVFIFDITGSMRDEMNTLKSRCLEFADSIATKGVDYRLGLVTFADEVLSIQDFTSDAREFKTWIDALSAHGGGDPKKNALEALEAAAGLSFRDVTQKIAILITDADYHQAGETGHGTTEFTTESMISFLNARDILCNIVGPDMPQHKKIARQTGGYFYLINDDFSDIIDRLGEQIINQYVITFVPTNMIPDNTYRTISVTVDYNSLSGHEQHSYFIGNTRLVTHPPVILGLKGKRFTLDMYVQNVMNLSAAKYYLSYNKNKIKAIEANTGDFMASGGASEIFRADINHGSGIIEFNQSRLIQGGSTETISGSGHMASVEFEVLLDACSESINLYDLDFRNPDNVSIEITGVGSEIKSGGSTGSSIILCDFDHDLDIDLRDFALLSTYWKPVNNTLGDVGPTNGAVPLLTSVPDGWVDFEDLFTFTRMWNWYYTTLSGDASLAKTNGKLVWELIEENNGLRLNVHIQNVHDLSMGHVVLSFNNAILSAKQLTPGDLLMSQAFIADIDPNGYIDIAFSKMAEVNQNAALNQTGMLFSVRFEKTGNPGRSTFELVESDLRTRNNLPLSVNIEQDCHVNVESLPRVFTLSNYPNPFNNGTTIRYELPIESKVEIQIFNVLGQPVKTLVNKKTDAGKHQNHWDGTNDSGFEVVSGAYILKMKAGDQLLLRKILLLK